MNQDLRDAHMEAQTELLRMIVLMTAAILRRSSTSAYDATAQGYEEAVHNLDTMLHEVEQKAKGTEQ